MSTRATRIAIAGLSVVGAAITTYLLYTRFSGTEIACSTGGCETVQSSRYAEVAGVPVAALGLAGYLALLAASAVRGEVARAATLALALCALAFSIYLVVVQLAVLHAICVWCVGSDVVVLLISLLAAADATGVGEHLRVRVGNRARSRRATADGAAISQPARPRAPRARRTSRPRAA